MSEVYKKVGGTERFNVSSYLSRYIEKSNAFGDNQDLAIRHYVDHGFAEGRNVVA